MDRWSDFSNQIDSAFGGGAAQAPAPGQPGMGAGNVPHAPGIMSGKYPGMTPDAAKMYAGVAQSQPSQPMAQPGGMPQPGPGGQPQQFNPQMQAHILDYLMRMMMGRAESGQTSPISSTGTF